MRFSGFSAVATALLVTSGLIGSTIVGNEPDDPYFTGIDQWGLQRIGLLPQGSDESGWDIETGESSDVVVAIVDSGIDFFHPDLSRETIWQNPREQLNGEDDDGNGYVDDVIGWNFVDDDNNPWDLTGHGTHLAGIIAAATDNGEGIAGINRRARIMPLKALNFVGRGRSVTISEAIYYAVENGARVINLSLGGHHVSEIEKTAIDYAAQRDVLVVVAAGNEGADAGDYGPAGLDNVITVGASGPDDRRTTFSNWGTVVDLVAPGTDILSLRARRTDFILFSDATDYEAGRAFVGSDARYYRASGTSFSAPFVSGVASLILARDPSLDAASVRRMLLQSARDLQTPGLDHQTGYGLLDARAALAGDPDFFVEAFIKGVGVVQRGRTTYVRVTGTANADAFGSAWIELGAGENPADFRRASRAIQDPVRDGTLDDLEAEQFRGSGQWTLRLVTVHENGRRRESRFLLNLE
jgi:subtilisin family serine protease